MNDKKSLESRLSESEKEVEQIRFVKASIKEEVEKLREKVEVLLADMAVLETKEEELVIQQFTIKERLEKLQEEEELLAAMAILTAQNKEKQQQPEDRQKKKKGGCVVIPRGAVPPSVAFPVSDVRLKQGEMPKSGAMPNSDEKSKNAEEVVNESGGEREESTPVEGGRQASDGTMGSSGVSPDSS